MKTLKILFTAGLALAASLAARADISAQAWLESYYLNPQPAEVSRGIQKLSREGYFDRSENVAVAIGFLSTVFSQHPVQVDGWVAQARQLPERHQRIIAASLWQAGHPQAPELLRAMGRTSSVRAEVDRLANTPSQPVADTSVASPSSMRLQWGAFLASGDERHIVRILDAIGSGERTLTTVAQMSLAQQAATHPRVAEICRAQLERQPDEVRSVLRAALKDVPAPAPRS
jgi:hypothetical protein